MPRPGPGLTTGTRSSGVSSGHRDTSSVNGDNAPGLNRNSANRRSLTRLFSRTTNDVAAAKAKQKHDAKVSLFVHLQPSPSIST